MDIIWEWWIWLKTNTKSVEFDGDKINWKAKIYLGNITKEIANQIHEDTKNSIEEMDENKKDAKDDDNKDSWKQKRCKRWW